jgi:hypothetical protein
VSHRRRQVRLAHDVAGLAELDRELAKFGTQLPVAVERAEGLHCPQSRHLLLICLGSLNQAKG